MHLSCYSRLLDQSRETMDMCPVKSAPVVTVQGHAGVTVFVALAALSVQTDYASVMSDV